MWDRIVGGLIVSFGLMAVIGFVILIRGFGEPPAKHVDISGGIAANDVVQP